MVTTLVHYLHVHKGLQSVLFVATLVTVYGYEGAPVHIGFRDEPIEGQTENPLKL